MAMADFDGSYAPGIRQFSGDSGVVAIASNSQVATATFSPAPGSGTVVQRGMYAIAGWNLAGSLSTVNVEMTDGTNFEYCCAYPAPAGVTATEAFTYSGMFFTPLLASALGGIAAATGVTGIRATIATTTTNTGSVECRANGGV